MSVSRKKSNFALVIELERHIEILLLSNDCVIVPELGGFMAHHVDARYCDSDNLFLPPLRTLGFNPQLRLNDHLLVQSYIETYDISYPEALRRIEEEVNELKQYIEAYGEYELNGIGVLRLNDEGHYEFEPCEAGILTPEYYGLSTFEMIPLSQQAQLKSIKAEEIKLETAQPADTTDDEQKETAAITSLNDDNDTIIIRMSWIRNVVAVAIAVVAFFMMGTPISNNNTDLLVQQSSIIPTMTITENEPANTESLVNNALTTKAAQVAPVAETSSPETFAEESIKETFTIVLVSQTPLKHANEFIERMSKSGFDQHISIREMKGSSKVRVIYHSFSSQEEAQDSLRVLRKQHAAFKEAWVMKI